MLALIKKKLDKMFAFFNGLHFQVHKCVGIQRIKLNEAYKYIAVYLL